MSMNGFRRGVLILMFAQFATPNDSHAVGPDTHLVRWSAYGTNVLIGLTNTIKISSGFVYLDLALQADSTLTQVGGSYASPAGLSNVIAMATGWSHSLAARSDGSVVAWGSNNDGETTIPPGLTNVVDVGCGGHNSAALRSDGTVVAWGNNDHNQTNVPPGLSNVVDIRIGYSYGLALRENGTVEAWGLNYGHQTPAFVPTGLSNVVSVTGTSSYFVALHADGSLTAWGPNGNEQNEIPPGSTNIVAIASPASTSGAHYLALREDGTVLVWGCDCNGATTVPPGLSNIVAIAAGSNGDGSDYNLVLVADGPFFTSPRLDIGSSNGLVQINVTGEAHRRYVLESATTLGNTANWAFVRNARLTNTYQTVHQFTAPQTDTRFYRVRQLH